jgi:hypothetical protein
MSLEEFVRRGLAAQKAVDETNAPKPMNAPSRMYIAVRKLQDRHINALTTGEGRGLSTIEMVEHLEQESGYADLILAADAAWHLCQSILAVRARPTDDPIVECRDALASALLKARGQS